MKIHFVVVFLTIITVPSTSAQISMAAPAVKWSTPLNIDKDYSFDHLFGFNDKDLYMIIKKDTQTFVHKINLDNQIVYQKNISMRIDNATHIIKTAELVNGQIYILTTHFDDQEKTNQLSLRVYQEFDLAQIGPLRQLASGIFDVAFSPNKRWLLVSQQLQTRPGEKDEIKLMVYDDLLNLHWEQEILLPYTDDEFQVEQYYIDESGSVILVGKKIIMNTDNWDADDLRNAKYQFHVLSYSRDKDVTHKTIQFDGKFIKELALNLEGDGDIIAGGFYGSEPNTSVNGVYCLHLDRIKKDVVSYDFKEFDNTFVTAFMNEKEKKRPMKLASNGVMGIEYHPIDRIIRDDLGGAIMISEQYFFHNSWLANGTAVRTPQANFLYNDIIVVSFDLSGMIQWVEKIPKRQITTDDNGVYSSYALANRAGHTYVLFNDDKRNLDPSPERGITHLDPTGSNVVMVLASIDKNGLINRTTINSAHSNGFILRPRLCRQVMDDIMFIYAQEKKNFMFGLMPLD